VSIEGMNVDAVRQLSRDLRGQSVQLDGVCRRVDGFVSRTAGVWQGRDASDFVSWWRDQHRPKVMELVRVLEGLAQSASNNADEQEKASGAGKLGADGGVASVIGGAIATAARHLFNPEGGAEPASGTQDSAAGHSGAVDSPPAAPALNGQADAEKVAMQAFVDRYKGTKIDFDGAYGAQCFDVFQKYSHTVAGVPAGTHVATNSDKACDIYNLYDSNGTSAYYDRIPYGQNPQPGDIVVYGATKTNSYGHVALVTSVAGDRYSVLEQNYYDKNLNPEGAGLVPAAVHEYSFKPGILGYLRPKNPTPSV